MRGLRVLDQVGLMLAPGELVGLIGPNAAGKTTLVRTLAGLRQPDDGTVLFDGTPIAALPRPILARPIGRAAGRERVYQEVSISVVADSFKNKKHRAENH